MIHNLNNFVNDFLGSFFVLPALESANITRPDRTKTAL